MPYRPDDPSFSALFKQFNLKSLFGRRGTGRQGAMIGSDTLSRASVALLHGLSSRLIGRLEHFLSYFPGYNTEFAVLRNLQAQLRNQLNELILLLNSYSLSPSSDNNL